MTLLYIIDTSAFIDWWVRYYSPVLLPTLKANVEALIAEGRFKSSTSVYKELEIGGDDLHDWAKLYKEEIFIEDDLAAQTIAVELNDKYSSPDRPKLGIGGADAFVIARAKLSKTVAAVVSGEKEKTSQNPKIPFVCSEYGIQHMSFADFWKNEGWKF